MSEINMAGALPCAFPFFLDGPAGECIGVAPHDLGGVPVVCMTAVRLSVEIDRGEDRPPVTGDLAGHEGLIGLVTLQRNYIAAGWTLRRYDYANEPTAAVERAAHEHLVSLLPPTSLPDPLAPGGAAHYQLGRRLAEIEG